MNTTMFVLIVMALLATVVSLAWGVGSMAHGGKYDTEHSQKLMTSRVVFQGTAFLLLLVAIIASL